MGRQVNLKKRVFSRTQFNNVVDRQFNTYTKDVPIPSLTIEEFFQAYDDLYFVIDVEGDSNSHEFLIKRSSELVDFEQDTQDISVLLDEIASLRERLLLANQNLVNLETQLEQTGIPPNIQSDLNDSSTRTDATTEGRALPSTEGSTTYTPNTGRTSGFTS